jgi:uncharacterized membrane protein
MIEQLNDVQLSRSFFHMNRNAKILMAGSAGAAAGFFAVRMLGGKRINTLPYGYGIKIKKEIAINAPAERLYNYWRNLTNQSTLFDNIVTVDVLDDTLSHWTLKAPGGITLEWDAEITVDRKNAMIGWRSLQEADLDNAGYVRFERAPGGDGTVVRVALQYNPPAGKVGAALATLFGEKPEGLIHQALRRLKQKMEAGEIGTVNEEQLSHSMEPVETASEDSFPASDPPAWTGTTGPTG